MQSKELCHEKDTKKAKQRHKGHSNTVESVKWGLIRVKLEFERQSSLHVSQPKERSAHGSA
jgi:hypothetical protein